MTVFGAVSGGNGMSGNGYGDSRRRLNAARLWSGGLATAVVAGLVVLVGALVARGVLGVPVLAPEEAGYFGDAGTGVYAALAALSALLATALLHLLLVSAPRPLAFFGWIIGLAVVIAAVGPFAQEAPLATQVTTATINLVAGLAIASLLGSVGAGARTRRPGSHAPDGVGPAGGARQRPRRGDGTLPGTGYTTQPAGTPIPQQRSGRHRGPADPTLRLPRD
ncbi:hypothetical protein SAMN02745673_04683 [Marinactinospora thermotolerans DSM 45154]|uniref:Uncharacterized protein n=2 Tax=Marinactinospora thermotolerans TaxID=531310 RepID=A0A1T4T9T9_9ACTN|nr:hypothetical protein SAMN02745673_04683 [Marinactinospora thermotolerans DSM 45154]